MKIELKIVTRTPLWTGDAEKKCERLHETGLIGSLRWWFEVVLRGLGFYACDPTQRGGDDHGKGACSLDAEKYSKNRDNGAGVIASTEGAGLCPACVVFGATGWRKILQLKIDDRDLKPIMKVGKGPSSSLFLPSGRKHESKDELRDGGWYLLPGLHGSFLLTFNFRPPLAAEQIQDFDKLFRATLKFVESWAAIGAKQTAGYGVVQIDSGGIPGEGVAPDKQLLLGALLKDENAGDFPRLDRFFFAKIRFQAKKNNWWREFKEVELALNGRKGREVEVGLEQWLQHKVFPLSPIVRNWLRYTWYRKLDKPKPKEALIFGTASNNRRRTAIGISHAYLLEDNLWEIRLWGFRPPGLEETIWEEFVDELYQALKISEKEEITSPKKETLHLSIWASPKWEQGDKDWHNSEGLWGGIVNPKDFVWREFNSKRDTAGEFSDTWEFFKSLVEGREKKDG